MAWFGSERYGKVRLMGLERRGQVGFSEARKGMANGHGAVLHCLVRQSLDRMGSQWYGRLPRTIMCGVFLSPLKYRFW